MSRLGDIKDVLRDKLEPLREHGTFYVTTGKTVFDEQNNIDTQNFSVVATVGRRSEANEDTLDEFLDPFGSLSVKEHLEGDRSLADHVIDVRVTATSGMRLYPEPEEPPQLGAEWTVECLLEGD